MVTRPNRWPPARPRRRLTGDEDCCRYCPHPAVTEVLIGDGPLRFQPMCQGCADQIDVGL